MTLKEPRGVDGQRAAYCSCGAVYFSVGNARWQHFKREGHDKLTWRRYREVQPALAIRLAK